MAFYEITNFSSLWWTGRKWTTQSVPGCGTHRYIGKDGRKAWREFLKLGQRFPVSDSQPRGFILLKWYMHKGERLLQEWHFRKDNPAGFEPYRRR